LLPKSVYFKMILSLLLLGIPLFFIVQYKGKKDAKEGNQKLAKIRGYKGLENILIKKDTVQKGEIYVHLYQINNSISSKNTLQDLMDNVSKAISILGFNFYNIEFMDIQIPNILIKDKMEITKKINIYFRNPKFKLEVNAAKDNQYHIIEMELIK